MERLYLKPSLCKAITEYCEINNITDINAFANRCAMQGFNIAKYGLSPSDNIERENKGIKDFKNENRKKRKEQPEVFGEKERGKNQEDIGTISKGKEEGDKDEPIVVVTREKDSKQTEEAKNTVTVRKIRIIKKG
jgi:hypothetical protein